MSGHWSQHQVVSYMSVCLFLFTTQNMSYSFLFISKNIDQIHLSVICINSPPKLQIVAMIVNILIKIDRAAGNWNHFSWSLATFEMLILVLNTVGARNLVPTISAYCLWCLSFPKLEPDYNCSIGSMVSSYWNKEIFASADLQIKEYIWNTDEYMYCYSLISQHSGKICNENLSFYTL